MKKIRKYLSSSSIKMLWGGVIALAIASLLSSCTEPDYLIGEDSIGSLRIGLQAMVEESDFEQTRSESASEPLKQAWCVVVDKSGDVFKSARSFFNPVSSELVVESLPVGKYMIAVLATSDSTLKLDRNSLNHVSDRLILSDKLGMPIETPLFYKRFDVEISADRGTIIKRLQLDRCIGKVDIDLQFKTPWQRRFIKSVKISLDGDDSLFSEMTVGGNFQKSATISNYDITKSMSFLSLPSQKGVSGKVEIVSASADGNDSTNLISRTYRFSNLNITAGKRSRITIAYLHPEQESGIVYLRAQDLVSNPDAARLQLDTIFMDREPQSVFYNTQRRGFYVHQPLKIAVSADGMLNMTLFAPVTIRNVDIYCRFPKICSERVLLAHFDEIYPFMEASVKLPMTERECILTTESGRRVRFPQKCNFGGGDAELEIKSEDPYLKKIEKIKHRWYISFGAYSANNENPGNWANMTPQLCRMGVSLIVNMAYMFSSDEFIEGLESQRGILKDNSGNDIELDNIHRAILNISRLTMGQCRNVGGLGGGSTYGLAGYCYMKCFYDGPSYWYWDQEPIFHEFGHIIGYGHSSNMTYGAWPTFCIPFMFDMQRQGKLPVNSFHTIDKLPRK